jgi:hypothetical protein
VPREKFKASDSFTALLFFLSFFFDFDFILTRGNIPKHQQLTMSLVSSVPVSAPNVCARVLKARIDEHGNVQVFQNTICDSIKVVHDGPGAVNVVFKDAKVPINEKTVFVTALPHSSGYDYMKYRGLRAKDGHQAVWLELCRNGACAHFDFFLSVEVFA